MEILDFKRDPKTAETFAKTRARAVDAEGIAPADLLEAADQEPAPAPRGPFPTHALPEPLRSMVKHAAWQTTAPEALCAAWGLGVSSAAMGAAYGVKSGPGQVTRGNLYILAFAESGSGKGQSSKVMLEPWLEEEARLSEEWVREERPRLLAEVETASADLEQAKLARKKSSGTTESAAAALSISDAIKRKDEAERALARAPLLNVGNATGEAIAEALSNAPGEACAVISAEARDVVANLMGRYSKDGKGSDEAIYLQAYSGDQTTHKRKGREPITLRAPCLVVCLAAQPDILAAMTGDPRLSESGFLARTLIFDSRARPMRPSSHVVPRDTAGAWGRAIHALMQRRREPSPPLTIQPGADARRAIDNLANEAADKREEGGEWKWCCSSAARLAENTWRLALVFHALRHPTDAGEHELSATTASDAETVARWFFGETLALLAPQRERKTTNRMEALINVFRDKNTKEMPVWKLANNHGFSEEELRSLAEGFPARLTLTKGQAGPAGGKPSYSAKISQA